MTMRLILALVGAASSALRGTVTCRQVPAATEPPQSSALWQLAKQNETIHRFSTLFTAQDVREQLSSETGLGRAIDWCQQTGVTKVYLEEFRDGYQAEREALWRKARPVKARSSSR